MKLLGPILVESVGSDAGFVHKVPRGEPARAVRGSRFCPKGPAANDLANRLVAGRASPLGEPWPTRSQATTDSATLAT